MTTDRTDTPRMDAEKALVQAVLNLFSVTGSHAFSIPILNTTPALYIVASENREIAQRESVAVALAIEKCAKNREQYADHQAAAAIRASAPTISAEAWQTVEDAEHWNYFWRLSVLSRKDIASGTREQFNAVRGSRGVDHLKIVNDVIHHQGCEALGGYGYSTGPCTCGVRGAYRGAVGFKCDE